MTWDDDFGEQPTLDDREIDDDGGEAVSYDPEDDDDDLTGPAREEPDTDAQAAGLLDETPGSKQQEG